MSTRKIWNLVEIPNIPFSGKLPCNSILQSSCIPNIFYEYGIMSNSIIYSCLSQSYNDDSINETLETLSNFHSALIKDFLNHHMIRECRMRSSLTRSDRFLVDLLTTFVHNPPYPEHPVHDFSHE